MGDRAFGRKIAPYALAFALFATYTVLSVSRHRRLRTSGYDLGIFEQAVRAYAQLRLPVAELKGPGFPLLGDHFHPILALLGPVYRVFPSPVTLLVAQAALMAASAIPVCRLAIRTVGLPSGMCVGIAYGLSWGLQRAVFFEFHEICFAVPLLAFALEGLAQRRWRTAALWAAPLVLVKEDLPFVVAAIGLYMMWRGERRLGAIVAGAATAAGLLIILVIIPGINPHHAYDYASSLGGTGQDPLLRLFTPRTKLATALLLLLPTAFLAVRSPLILLAVPTLAWRFWSSNPNYWGTAFHYNAALMPIVFVAFVDALRSLRSLRGLPWTLLCRSTVGAGALAAVIAVAMTPTLPLRHLVDPLTWRTDPWAAAVRAVLDGVPDGVSVAAANRLAPQLTARCEVYLFPNYPTARFRPEWIAVTDPSDASLIPRDVSTRRLVELADLGYELVVRRDGVLLFRREEGPDVYGA